MSKRVRDPVHGLIVFDDSPLDKLAWNLIDTSEFQRLRRIRQLGVSEFTFPGAVHTRFTHSIGVFHTARALVRIVEREMARNDQKFEHEKAEVVLIAALLHDVGHGPFSHAFEGVQASRGVKKRHEQWTAEIIRSERGQIKPLLERWKKGVTQEVALLLEKEDPENIYHAIVSSSFDADRLDYLQRDRLMTGIGAGAIDFDWLLENIRVAEVVIDAPDEEGGEPRRVPTFCLAAKALPAAEQFLYARYTLHQQVYFHKTTRCVEHMISALLRAVAQRANAAEDVLKTTGLPPTHPMIRFFAKGGETVVNYLALDDALVYGALEEMSRAEDPVISAMSGRIRDRHLYKTLDLVEFGADVGAQRMRLRKIGKKFEKELTGEKVIVDDKASIGIYAEIGGDEERMHKKLHVLDGGLPVEISKLSPMIHALETKQQFNRVYFANRADRDVARK